MNLMIVYGMLVCSSVYVYCVESCAHIECYSDCSRRGSHFATVLFSVCSVVNVECCVLYPCCVGVFGMFAVIIIIIFNNNNLYSHK